jgi:ABC-type sugar transport system permease subunit
VKNRKYRSIEWRRSRFGYFFTLHWSIGFILFFAVPVIQSIIYSFSDVVLSTDGVQTDFVGIINYKDLLTVDPNYNTDLSQAMGTFLYSLPVILLLSIVIALLLNQKFKGRVFFRALYFTPVIIASGVVIKLMFQTTSSDLVSAGVSSSITDSMFTVEDVVTWLNLPDAIAEYVKIIINTIFDMVWSCGVQIVLIIAGLQSIPRSLYEASRVEGASKWQEFWFITFPSLGSVMLLVIVYTTVDLFASTQNTIVGKAYSMMSSGVYDTASAMLWFYFLVVGVVMGILLFAYNRILMKRWQ